MSTFISSLNTTTAISEPYKVVGVVYNTEENTPEVQERTVKCSAKPLLDRIQLPRKQICHLGKTLEEQEGVLAKMKVKKMEGGQNHDKYVAHYAIWKLSDVSHEDAHRQVKKFLSENTSRFRSLKKVSVGQVLPICIRCNYDLVLIFVTCNMSCCTCLDWI